MIILRCICRGGGPPKAVEGPSLATRPFTTCVGDVSHNTLKIISYIRSRDSDRLDSAACEPCVPSLVALWVSSELMRKAIYLDCNSYLVAKVVEIIWTMLILFTKFEAVRPGLDRVP